jgi:hypothetical protein
MSARRKTLGPPQKKPNGEKSPKSPFGATVASLRWTCAAKSPPNACFLPGYPENPENCRLTGGASGIRTVMYGPSPVGKAAASDCSDPVAVMYSAFCWSAALALRAMMEIRAPFPDQANGLQCPDSSTGLKGAGPTGSPSAWQTTFATPGQVLPQRALQAAARTR